MYSYIELLKPRLSATVIFSALAGYLLATNNASEIYYDIIGDEAEFTILKLLIGGVLLVGASNGLNQVYEVNVDKLMERTKDRVLPLGLISLIGALIFGIFLSIISVALLYIASNLFSAGLLGFTIFYYVFIYTIWLKKSTSQNIVIGGAAGAFPPIIWWSGNFF